MMLILKKQKLLKALDDRTPNFELNEFSKEESHEVLFDDLLKKLLSK